LTKTNENSGFKVTDMAAAQLRMMNDTAAVSVPSPRTLPEGEGDIVSLRDVHFKIP
jgi:hypothetical protein